MKALQEYIESGVLELYVLGALTSAERAEVGAMAENHEEVRREIAAIESAMEAHAFENAVTPLTNIEARVMSQISSSVTEPKVLPLYKESGNVKFLRYALIACSLLLVLSLGLLISTYKNLTLAKSQIAALNVDKEQFATTVSQLEFSKAGMENRIAMFENKTWTTVKLAGVGNSPKSEMVVYWNNENKRILINHTAMDLPKTDAAHEYQLWALVDGKPVSLGVFGATAKKAVQQMQTIEKAQAFAVTIEPKGGSINPTMDKMVVMGGV